MRRKDKEIKDRKILDEIIKKSEICYLSMSDNDIPYVVPMNFGYDGKNLYFHCAKKGKKIDIIGRKNRVSIAMTSQYKLKLEGAPNTWTTKYKSVIIEGEAEILEELSTKQKGIGVILQQYADVNVEFSEKILNNVAIIKVKFLAITGKGNID